MSTLENAATGCVVFNLRRASRIVTRRYEQALRPVNLSAFQFSALVALAKAGKLPQAKLASFMGMDVSTLTRNLKPLIKRQLIETRANPRDGRAKVITITNDGRACLDRALPLWEDAQQETLKELNADEWAGLKQAIKLLA
ncbi:MAG: MarR family winged helix-turn-helix transcriptional regulator [Pseudomonadota bacterium]